MVLRLELLRHAKSSWDDPGLPDRDRPLAPRGVKACVRLRDHLGRVGCSPEVVLCSPATRAVQTLIGIRDGLAGDPEVEIEDEIYTASADELFGRLRAVPGSVGWTMVIGHNPGIEALALGLVDDGDADALQRMRSKYPTGGLASLAFDGEWRRLAWGGARLEAFTVPRALK
jgi:phosphohistidine phosphatase